MNPQSLHVFKLSILVLHIIPIIFASTYLATKSSYAKSYPIRKEVICNFTPNPSYCNSILPNQTSNAYNFTRYVIHKSLSQSHKLHNLMKNYLHTNLTLSKTATLALKDCRFLAQLNVDLLASALETLTGANKRLSGSKIDDVRTWLSAVLTNQEACLNGVKEASFSYSWRNMQNGLLLLDDTNLFSVALALFTKAWLPLKEEDDVITLFTWRRKQKLHNFDDVVVSESVTVSKNGSGNFRTIKKAVAAAPIDSGDSKGYYVIYIKKGVYREYVKIARNKRYVMMIGEGINKTIITGDRNVKDGWTTFHSATFVVDAPYFVAVNMTIRNTAGPTKHQAVAVRNGGDQSAFYQCSFEGYQDTLYAHSQRQFYKKCNIYGTVDFIFGNSAAVLQQCNIHPRLRKRDKAGYITAQGRSHPNQATGIVIDNCNIRGSNSEKGKTKAYLGRPWRDYSRTVIMNSYMDSCVVKEGWKKWRSDSALRTLYYAEYKCRGAGSNTKGRVKWPGYHVLRKSNEAKKFTVGKFLHGKKWLPQTGVPFTSGLK